MNPAFLVWFNCAMNNTKFCLLIGNEGSFSEFIHNYLLEDGYSITSIFLKPDSINLELICASIESELNSNKITSVIYIGGEVRNINRMDFLNFSIPKHIALFCLKYKVEFIYLSSLAALGNFYKGLISPLSLIKKRPFNEYGKTKQNFDSWIEGIPEIYSLTKAIYPASILGRSHNKSSLQKMINIFKKYPILRHLNFKTIITFCDRSEIAFAISNALHSSDKHKIVVSHNLQLSTLRSFLYPGLTTINLPSFIYLLDIFIFFLPRKIRIFLISSCGEAIYSDNSSKGLLSIEQLSEICIKYKINIH